MRNALIATVLGLTVSIAPATGEPARCDWGGTPSARTGVFTITPGLRNVPSDGPLAIAAEGALTGTDDRCAGRMFIEGTFGEGASCAAVLREEARVWFEDAEGNPVDRGITRYVGAGGAHTRALLLSEDGEVKGTVDPFARSRDQIPFTESCNSDDGLSEGTFSTTTGLVFFD